MLLLSVSTKKRKHNWEITKRDLTKLTSPSVRTKNDWSRRASGQKIGYLNSRTLRSVRLFFFSPSPGVLGRSHPRGFPALTLPMLTALEKHERSPLTIFRSGSRKRARPCAVSRIPIAAIRASVSRAPFRSFGAALPSALRLLPSGTPSGLQLSLRRHTKKRDTHHGGECRVEAGGMLSARDSLTTSSV